MVTFGLKSDVSAKVLHRNGYEFSMTNLLGYSRSLIDTFVNLLSSKEGDVAFEVPIAVVDSTDPIVLEFSAGNGSVSFAIRLFNSKNYPLERARGTHSDIIIYLTGQPNRRQLSIRSESCGKGKCL